MPTTEPTNRQRRRSSQHSNHMPSSPSVPACFLSAVEWSIKRIPFQPLHTRTSETVWHGDPSTEDRLKKESADLVADPMIPAIRNTYGNRTKGRRALKTHRPLEIREQAWATSFPLRTRVQEWVTSPSLFHLATVPVLPENSSLMDGYLEGLKDGSADRNWCFRVPAVYK